MATVIATAALKSCAGTCALVAKDDDHGRVDVRHPPAFPVAGNFGRSTDRHSGDRMRKTNEGLEAAYERRQRTAIWLDENRSGRRELLGSVFDRDHPLQNGLDLRPRGARRQH